MSTFEDTITDTEAEVTDEVADLNADTETVIKDGEDVTPKPKRPRIAPTYELGFVGDELPADEKVVRTGGQGRPGDMFVELLSPIVADADLHGAWLVVAEYGTSGGAKGAKKAIDAGERIIPAGLWEFDSRRFNAPLFVNADGKTVLEAEGNEPQIGEDGEQETRRCSRLYVKYHGADGEASEGQIKSDYVAPAVEDDDDDEDED